MNKQEAIEYIQEWLKDEYALNGKDKVILNMAIEALQDNWIQVSERLPEAKYGESDRLLVTKCWKEDEDTQFVEEAYFNGSYWCEPTGECITNAKVVAWQPLPEPYKGENNG